MSTIVKDALEVFNVEISELIYVKEQIKNSDFEKAINEIFNCSGRVIVTGMGKSGIIGQKIAASLSSTGTTSFFVHPGEAYHGDLGMFNPNDIVIALSNSGETDEVLKIVPFLKFNKNKIIAISGNQKSTLAKNSDFFIPIKVRKEACPLNVAPTTSTTATLVMGDAIMIALMKKRKFQLESFAKLHPGGNLGKKLLLQVKDKMRQKYLPVVNYDSEITEVINKMSEGKLGLVIVKKNTGYGIITDGDLRRALDKYKVNIFTMTPGEIMTPNPIYIAPEESLYKAKEILEEKKITLLLVGSPEKLNGVIQIYDID